MPALPRQQGIAAAAASSSFRSKLMSVGRHGLRSSGPSSNSNNNNSSSRRPSQSRSTTRRSARMLPKPRPVLCLPTLTAFRWHHFLRYIRENLSIYLPTYLSWRRNNARDCSGVNLFPLFYPFFLCLISFVSFHCFISFDRYSSSLLMRHC